MGSVINSNKMDSDPIFSKDGKWLFFSSDRVRPFGGHPEKIKSYQELKESLSTPDNGLMNIYRVDISAFMQYVSGMKN